MKDITYQVTSGHATRTFSTKSSAAGWLAEEIRYTGRYGNLDTPDILARSIVNTGKSCVIKGKTFGITTR